MKIDTSHIESQFTELNTLLKTTIGSHDLNNESRYEQSIAKLENIVNKVTYPDLVMFLGYLSKSKFNAPIINELLPRDNLLDLIHGIFANQTRSKQ